MPRHIQILVLVFAAYTFVNFMLFFYLSEGASPGISIGSYVLQSHGTVIRELTESEYNWQQAYILRGFSGHWLIFYLLPAVYFWYSTPEQDTSENKLN